MFVLTLDIVEAVKRGGESLRQLSAREVDFATNARGDLAFWGGNNVVVFRVLIDGVCYAMRCYRSHKPHLRAIYGENYYPRELEIHRRGDTSAEGSMIDVVLCEWVEGRSLNRVIESIMTNDLDDRVDRMGQLSRSFDILAKEMLNREDWAHGDLSGDNILVDEDLRMSLIDHDAAFVEELSGCERSEMGTPYFQPLNSALWGYNSTMDHFSIALISLSLRAMAIDPELWSRYPLADGLLLNGELISTRGYRPFEEVERTVVQAGDFVGARLARIISCRDMLINELPRLIDFSVKSSSLDAIALELYDECGVWGYKSSESGDVIIPPLFDEAFEFEYGEARVRVADVWYYINCDGRMVVDCDESNRWNPRRMRYVIK